MTVISDELQRRAEKAAKKLKRPKCLTCKHHLDEHTEDQCLHWNWDSERLCKCKDGADGVVVNKVFEKVRLVSVVTTGNNFIWFKDREGKHWRWMFKEKKLFPIEVVL